MIRPNVHQENAFFLWEAPIKRFEDNFTFLSIDEWMGDCGEVGVLWNQHDPPEANKTFSSLSEFIIINGWERETSTFSFFFFVVYGTHNYTIALDSQKVGALLYVFRYLAASFRNHRDFFGLQTIHVSSKYWGWGLQSIRLLMPLESHRMLEGI